MLKSHALYMVATLLIALFWVMGCADRPGGSDATDIGLTDVDMGPDCTYEGFQASDSFLSSPLPGHVTYTAEQHHENTFDRLEITLHHGGAFSGLHGAGSADLSDSPEEGCHNCATLSLNCLEGDGCEKTFLATWGTLELTTWNDSLMEGQLTNGEFHELSPDSPDQNIPLQNGEIWCLDSYSFLLETGSETAPVESEANCVADGTGTYVGHNIADFTLTNCLGEPVFLHENCGGRDALWLMGTTGWCADCTVLLEALSVSYGGLISRDILNQQTPGLDMWVVLSEDQDYLPVTEESCLDYATTHGIDPAMVLMDYSSIAIPVPLVDPFGESTTFQGMGTTWSHINPYLTQDSSGGVLYSYPWQALLRGENMAYYWSDNIGTGQFSSSLEKLLDP